jgi:hypothetical protein
MAVLVVVGVALVVFGAFVLVRFPDRPGGRLVWHGVEVSSVGAGFPLSSLAAREFRAADVLSSRDRSADCQMPHTRGILSLRLIASDWGWWVERVEY